MPWRLHLCVLAAGVAACAPASVRGEPLPRLAAERVVNLSEVESLPLTQHFALVSEFANPCGTFPAALSFGASGDALRASCLPDPRRATEDQSGRYRGLVSPPDGHPWRVAIDVLTGQELARLEHFFPCSPQLDSVEVALGGGTAVYGCRLSRDDHRVAWRAVDEGGSAETTVGEMPFRIIAAGDHLVRQSGVGPAGGWIPNPQVMPASGGGGNWTTVLLPTGLDCASLTNSSIDGTRALMTAGRLEGQTTPEGRTYQRCIDQTSLAYDPSTNRWSVLPIDGAFGALDRRDRAFVNRDRGGGWAADDQLFYVVEADGHIPVAFSPGPLVDARHSRLFASEGEGLLVLEAVSMNEAGESEYFVFDWQGTVLAAFHANRVALAPDRPRVIVVTGERMQAWELRSDE